MRFRELKLRRDPECPVCGDAPTIKALIDYEQFCGVGPQRAASAGAGTGLPPELETSVEDLKARLDRGERPFILDVREPHEYQINRIAGSTLIPLGELPQRLTELPQGAGAPTSSSTASPACGAPRRRVCSRSADSTACET